MKNNQNRHIVKLGCDLSVFLIKFIWAGPQQFLQDCMRAQRRFRSACASAKSDQSLRMALYGQPSIQSMFRLSAKTLISLCNCTGWSDSSLAHMQSFRKKTIAPVLKRSCHIQTITTDKGISIIVFLSLDENICYGYYLGEVLLMSTYNICFCWEIRKLSETLLISTHNIYFRWEIQ